MEEPMSIPNQLRVVAVLVTLVTSAAVLGFAWLSWQPSGGCTRRVESAEPGYVIVEDFCRYSWNSSSGDCDRRKRRVYLGLFLGPPQGPFLTCG